MKRAVYRKDIGNVIVLSKDKDTKVEVGSTDPYINYIIQVRREGNLKGNSFWLSDQYNWLLVEDDCGKTCLIPRRKGA